MAIAELNIVTVEEAAGVNQALVLQCLLVTLKDSPKKWPEEAQQPSPQVSRPEEKAQMPPHVRPPEDQVLRQLG